MKAMTLRLPDELYDALKSQAGKSHRSLHGQILGALEYYVRARAFTAPPLDPTSPSLDESGLTEAQKRLVDAAQRPVLVCTCSPGERAEGVGKGKHNRWCPMRGK